MFSVVLAHSATSVWRTDPSSLSRVVLAMATTTRSVCSSSHPANSKPGPADRCSQKINVELNDDDRPCATTRVQMAHSQESVWSLGPERCTVRLCRTASFRPAFHLGQPQLPVSGHTPRQTHTVPQIERSPDSDSRQHTVTISVQVFFEARAKGREEVEGRRRRSDLNAHLL